MRIPPQVIPHRVWQNQENGREVSLFGACPWTSSADESKWLLVQKGFSIRWPDGTVGCGSRGPAKTEEEAQAIIAARPRFGGFQQH